MSQDYTETLKKIKETEEAGGREVLERRKALEEQLRQLEQESNAAIADAKKKGEAAVAAEVEKVTRGAEKDADITLASTERQASQVSGKKLDKAALKKVIDSTLLAEFK